MADILSRTDIATVVEDFYQQAMQDPLIGHLFEGLDLSTHLPTINDFWENILFRTGAYKGGMMYKHLMLNARHPLQAQHFERWLALFSQTVDKHFSGHNATLAKQFAHSVAHTMQHKVLGTVFPLAAKDSPT